MEAQFSTQRHKDTVTFDLLGMLFVQNHQRWQLDCEIQTHTHTHTDISTVQSGESVQRLDADVVFLEDADKKVQTRVKGSVRLCI